MAAGLTLAPRRGQDRGRGALLSDNSGLSQSCAVCGERFDITPDALSFLARVSPTFASGLAVPPPTRCPLCRLQRRMAHRNQIYVRRTALSSGEEAFSMHMTAVPFPVLKSREWWGEEGWRAEEFGRPFDFSRSFFEQWRELRDAVPRPAVNVDEYSMENSSYCNNAHSLKNCYFVFDANSCEDCLCLESSLNCRDCIEGSVLKDCELCYDCAHCVRCYELQSATHCHDCARSRYLFNCRGCEDCVGCVNLRRAQYCVFNEQRSKDEYLAFVSALDLGSGRGRLQFSRKFEEFRRRFPQPHLFGAQLEDCSGNLLSRASHVHESCIIDNAERLRCCFAVGQETADCQDFTIWGQGAELVYEAAVCGHGVFRLLFCFNCWNGASELIYCDSCHGSQHCFGCVGLLKRRFCVLNRQYLEDEYHELVPRIVSHMRSSGEWGEFFPAQLSAAPYNCSLAQRYFPMTEEECLSRGLGWYEARSPEAAGALCAADLPDRVPEEDSPLVVRSSGGKIFGISAQEIRRLRRMRAPLPLYPYDERMNQRMQRLGGIRMYPRVCDRSGERLASIHPPDAPYAVWERELLERELCA
jgi:hypothetical protein